MLRTSVSVRPGSIVATSPPPVLACPESGDKAGGTAVHVKTICSIGCLLAIALLAGCKPQNAYVPPPPPQVGVAAPLQQSVTEYLEATGNTTPYNQIDLVARIEGFLSEIKYQDGDFAKQGTTLFVIEPAPYQAQLQEAQGNLALAQADLVQAEAEFYRQSTLAKQDFASQAALDQARAKRDGDKGKVDTQQGALTVAATNLSYTHVAASFDGIVTKHLEDIGALVGSTGPTKLATLVQLDPIYVTFNISEQDVLRVRQNLKQRRLTLAEINQVPIEVGLMDEDGFPHRGHLDYTAPEIDPSTGTLLVRGVFDNPDRALLPGFFVRIRVPMSLEAKTALLVPDRALGTNQAGRYLLVLGKDDMVEQRTVTVGQQYGNLRVVETGLQPDDRVVVEGISRAIPGRKVAPQTVSLASEATATTTAAAK
jgi:RND family efflux transporter MFP subunit